jgi:mxaJ protein
MSLRFRTSLLAVTALFAMGATPAQREFAVCVEPDNMPFANRAGEGFEPEIAALLAQHLDATLALIPVAQNGRGYVRSTLGRGRCDALIGVPAGAEGMTTSKPYYVTGWVFVSRTSRGFHVQSFDDPLLRRIRIGVPAVGEGYDTPPLAALGKRGVAANLHLYPISGLGESKTTPAQMIDDLVSGKIDLAIMWGPGAGYFGAAAAESMDIRPTPMTDGADIPLTVSIAIGVRRGNVELRDLINRILIEQKPQIDRILAAYHVPQVGE